MKASALERFAQAARKQLHAEVRARLIQIREGHLAIELADNEAAVKALDRRCGELGEEGVIEEAAYTWFNRICALRFMDARGYNETMIVSPSEGKTLPEILSDAISGAIDEEIAASEAQRARVRALLDGSLLSDNAQGEAYRILLVAACNSLNDELPVLFERIDDYTALLLPDDLLSPKSIVAKTVKAMTAKACESVEAIGWLYQHYISEKKAEVFAAFKKGKKAGAGEIPVATQLFTPEWIVRCLVENSLGRLWMLNHPDSPLKNKMKYYAEASQPEADFIRLERPEDIRLLDPCCGSGHILAYAFDLLVEIYRECGCTESEAATRILQNNLFGVEIDKRAGQLAWFALVMKAREKSRRALKSNCRPNICILKRIEFAKSEEKALKALFVSPPPSSLAERLSAFAQADVLGSLLEPEDVESLKKALLDDPPAARLSSEAATAEKAAAAFAQAGYLCAKYHVVVTNPPYLAPSAAVPALQDFAKARYPNSRTDTGTMFIERALRLVPENGYVAMVTLQSWMFLSSFEGLRQEIIGSRSILSLFHIGARGFDAIGGEVVSTAAFVLYGKRRGEDARGCFFRLVEGRSEEEKAAALRQALADPGSPCRFEASLARFAKMPGSPIAYWASEAVFDIFANAAPISKTLTPRQGLATADNSRFLRLWHEVSWQNIKLDARNLREALESGKKWFPYNKGGEYRKWHGNYDYIVNWQNDGCEIKRFVDKKGKLRSRPQNTSSYFKQSITWTLLSSDTFAARYRKPGSIHDVAGMSAFSNSDEELYYALALVNTKLGDFFFKMLNPTISLQAGNFSLLPYMQPSSPELKAQIVNIAQANIAISRADWDSFETSWDFAMHPLLRFSRQLPAASSWLLADSYQLYKDWANAAFFQLKRNEEELNRLFIGIYGLDGELQPEEDCSMVSVHRVFDSKAEIPESMKKGQYALTKKDAARSLISYAIGCMFGRYDPARPGLIFAGGEFDFSSYSDKEGITHDNVIPVLAQSYFADDAASRFNHFLEAQFGMMSLAANARFIEAALGKTVRDYLFRDFYRDHVKAYQKRPIYWLFSSPKGHFGALVYVYRWSGGTATAVLRRLRQFREKVRLQIKVEAEGGSAKKRIELENIDADLNDYETNILCPLAARQIALDLDDGVKSNYRLMGRAVRGV